MPLKCTRNAQHNVLGANAADVDERELNKDVLEASLVLGSFCAICSSRHVKLVLGTEFVADLVVDLEHWPPVVAHYMEPNSERAGDCGC